MDCWLLRSDRWGARIGRKSNTLRFGLKGRGNGRRRALRFRCSGCRSGTTEDAVGDAATLPCRFARFAHLGDLQFALLDADAGGMHAVPQDCLRDIVEFAYFPESQPQIKIF